MPVTEQYLAELAPIYRDILAAFPEIEPVRKAGHGLAIQTLFSQLGEQYSLGEITNACEQMKQGGAVEIKNRFFVHPTAVGEAIISALTHQTAQPESLPPFSPPPG